MKPVCAVVGVGPGKRRSLRPPLLRWRIRSRAARAQHGPQRTARVEPEDARAYACDATDAASVGRAFDAIRRDSSGTRRCSSTTPVPASGAASSRRRRRSSSSPGVNAFGGVSRLQAGDSGDEARRPRQHRVRGRHRVAQGRSEVRLVFLRQGGAAEPRGVDGPRSLARGHPRRADCRDGVVDLPRTRERMPDKSDSFFIRPDDVAETGFHLAQQGRSAWSFEVEARPFAETW